MNRSGVVDPRLAHRKRRRHAVELAAEITHDVGGQWVELEAEAQPAAIPRPTPVDYAGDRGLGIEPDADARQPKCHDDRLSGERRHVSHDQHSQGRQIDAAPADEAKIVGSDDLAFEPDGSAQGAPLMCMD